LECVTAAFLVVFGVRRLAAISADCCAVVSMWPYKTIKNNKY
jgi:hypothetical protein